MFQESQKRTHKKKRIGRKMNDSPRFKKKKESRYDVVISTHAEPAKILYTPAPRMNILYNGLMMAFCFFGCCANFRLYHELMPFFFFIVGIFDVYLGCCEIPPFFHRALYKKTEPRLVEKNYRKRLSVKNQSCCIGLSKDGGMTGALGVQFHLIYL